MSQSLFTSQTPSQNNQNDGTPTITRGMTLEFGVSGTVSGIRWWCPVTATGTYTVALWDLSTNTAGTLLASKVHVGTPTFNDWNITTFDTPVAVTASKTYRVGANNSEGRYVASSSFFTVPLTNGDLTAPANGGTSKVGFAASNGAFNISAALALPTTNVGPTNYFVDVVFDASGGSTNLAANFTATAGMGAALSNETRLATALTATASMSAAMVGETTLRAALAATASMSAALTVPSGPVDPIGSPVAEELLTCFTDQLQSLPSPPKYIQLRVGQDTGPLIGPNIDECCAGLAWIRIANIYPSWDSFPAADNTWLPCGPLAYAVVLEMGVAFCMPWSDSDDTLDNIDPPSANDWAMAFQTQMQHQTLMRRAAACCWRPTQRRAVGEWTPLPVEGGCTGGKMTVTVSVPAPCADC